MEECVVLGISPNFVTTRVANNGVSLILTSSVKIFLPFGDGLETATDGATDLHHTTS